ncbi:flagellar motor switch protein FliG [Providencia sneebia]|uniref:Flagellar motor switch protein FliG n=1 Tax=Providencia sneebia DSM 19967 TaxID=1141660 RepID=K8WDD1_9GAMM|nr:flagellar motor switch protein FliG [Providencia sneebia]EKT58579.1 flagellar motor switch protein G [Providencia sneebia DSM 19967]
MLNGIEKSAVTLMALNEDQAAEVFKYFSSKEIQQLSVAITNLRQISNQELIEVLNEFECSAIQMAAINGNTNDYLRSVLIKALGKDQANSLLEDIVDKQETTLGIESLNYMEPQIVADIIKDEHPQIIATILVHLKNHISAEILTLFDEELRNDIILRIASFGRIQPTALDELTTVLNQSLDKLNTKHNKMGGIKTAAEIINLMKNQHQESAINTIRAYDHELTQHILNEMFLFENLINLDDRYIQRILQEINTDSLVIALKGCHQDLQEHFLKNMPTRTAEIVREDLQSHSPIRMSFVENEQKAILLIVRRLTDKGEIIIDSGDDTYV